MRAHAATIQIVLFVHSFLRIDFLLHEKPTAVAIQWAEQVAHYFCRGATDDLLVEFQVFPSALDARGTWDAKEWQQAQAILMPLREWVQSFHDVMTMLAIDAKQIETLRDRLNHLTKEHELSLPVALYLDVLDLRHDILVKGDDDCKPILVYNDKPRCRLESISSRTFQQRTIVMATANFMFRQTDAAALLFASPKDSRACWALGKNGCNSGSGTAKGLVASSIEVKALEQTAPKVATTSGLLLSATGPTEAYCESPSDSDTDSEQEFAMPKETTTTSLAATEAVKDRKETDVNSKLAESVIVETMKEEQVLAALKEPCPSAKVQNPCPSTEQESQRPEQIEAPMEKKKKKRPKQRTSWWCCCKR